jgi:hypothetical protein
MLHIIYEFAYDVSVFRIQMAKKWYVVYKGKVPGVYEHWEDCLDGLAGFLFNVVHVRANVTELEFHGDQASTMEAADVSETVNYAINMWIGQCVFF